MVRRWLVLAALALGCRNEPRETPAAVLAPPVASSATPVVADAAAPAAPPPVAITLPSAEHLVAPFKGTRGHGFVAMTNHGQRVVVPIVDGDAIDGDKPVLVASFTKLFAAVATLRMVSRGELTLDRTIKDELPALGARPWSSSTIRELLTHTSLVPEFDDKSGFYRKTEVDFSSPTETLAKWVPADWSEKRGVYKYRNAELAIVGAILAAKAKIPAPDVLAREVFTLAKMTHAGILVRGPIPAGLDLGPMGPVRPQNFFTAGAGYASTNDLLAFFEALDGTTLLDDASKAILEDGAKERGFGALGCWAYPFTRPDGTTTKMVERPGSFGNVRLFSAYFPDEKRALVAWTGDGIEIARPRTGKGIGLSLARVALE